jgi:hypothetical protein
MSDSEWVQWSDDTRNGGTHTSWSGGEAPSIEGGVAESGAWVKWLSDVTQHLVHAYDLISRVEASCPDAFVGAMPLDLASRGICTALVSLDDCALVVWDADNLNQPCVARQPGPQTRGLGPGR